MPTNAVHAQESPRLRTRLGNGAIVLAERMPGAHTLSVQLFASSNRVEETPDTHGRRHLLEHLVAEGPGRKLDQRLESNACVLLARTHRDATQFEVTGNGGSLDLALSAIGTILQPLKIDQGRIDVEAGVLSQEIAIQPDSGRLSSAAWSAAYGAEGLDPLGNLESIRGATPAALLDLQTRQFAPNGLVLVISGPIDLDQATKAASKVLSGLKGNIAFATASKRGKGSPGRMESQGTYGEARGALVKDYKDPGTVASLAVALAIAGQFEQSFVTYTPSVHNGLVIIGKTDDNSGLGLKIDAMSLGSVSELFPLGKLMAKAWVERQLRTPSGSAYLRGLLLSQGEAHSPELMLEAIDRMTIDDFRSAFARFCKENAAIAVGVKR